MPDSLGNAAQVRAIIEQAVKATHELEGGHAEFVTRAEFKSELASLETRLDLRLENSMLKTRNWVLGGIIASSVMFGGGFLALITQFNRTADAVISMQDALETRRDWIDESDARDRHQDDALREVNPDYVPQPFEVRPR